MDRQSALADNIVRDIALCFGVAPGRAAVRLGGRVSVCVCGYVSVCVVVVLLTETRATMFCQCSTLELQAALPGGSTVVRTISKKMFLFSTSAEKR